MGWAKLLYEKCMLDRDDADHYASKLVKHDLSCDDLPDLTQALLKDVGIHRMGHVLAILKYAREVRDSRRSRSRSSRDSSPSGSSARSSSLSRSRSRSPTPPPIQRRRNRVHSSSSKQNKSKNRNQKQSSRK